APTTPGPSSERRGDDEGPKYMNSPETPIYHKGDMLYGLYLAKGGMRLRKEVIVVEGNLDVIASHKAGVENVVASSGTALTASQLRTLSRYTKRIVFALDEDAAGFGAAQRVFELAIQMQNDDPTLRFDIRCLIIPQGAGKDPDEVVQKDSELWRKVAEKSEDVVEYFFTKKIRDFEASGTSGSIDERTKLIEDLLPHAARIERLDQRHLYLLRVADATHVALGLLDDMVKKEVVRGGQGRSGEVKKGPGEVKGGLGKVQKTSPDLTRPHPTPTTKVDLAAAFLLGLALKHEAFTEEALGAVHVDMLADTGISQLYTELRLVYTANDTPVPSTQRNVFYSRLRAKLEGQGMARETSLLDALTLQTDELLAGLPPKEVRYEADRNIAILANARAQAQRKQLESAIREAELSGDGPRLAELVREYSVFLSGK
ncbi:MAG: toprim domain-containing protein, partial [Candidatus Uhrbacteria bacterium]|nr:toprim domain-containing protein [Candidatus Uhrbacteria bacterium]